MTRGPGRYSERNFRAAEQHYNAAEVKLLLLLLLLCQRKHSALVLLQSRTPCHIAVDPLSFSAFLSAL